MKLTVYFEAPDHSWVVCTPAGKQIADGYHPQKSVAQRAATLAGLTWLKSRGVSGTVVEAVNHESEESANERR